MSWTQPICGACWQAYCMGAHGELRTPSTVKDPPTEMCCTCGGDAEQGIYVRLDPKKVPFPVAK